MTIAQAFALEQASLRPMGSVFDGFFARAIMSPVPLPLQL
jgi:hypothetical protein